MAETFADWLNKNLSAYLDRYSAWMTFYRLNNFRWPDGMTMPIPKIYFDAEMDGAPADLVGYLQKCYEQGAIPELPSPPPGTTSSIQNFHADTEDTVSRAAMRGAAKGALVGAGLGLLLFRLMR